MEQFDKLIKEIAEKEEIVVPKEFDERVQTVLDELPSKHKKRKPGAVRAALIAAAACLLLVGTALAASPALRGMLAEALGNFAPYAHEQEGETYVIDGIEFKVVSALADDFTVRVYVEARDLEGDRLGKLLNQPGSVLGTVSIPIPQKDTGGGIATAVVSSMCLDYDAQTKTALLAFTSWGQFAADNLSGATVRLLNLCDLSDGSYQLLWENKAGTAFPVEIEPVPSLVAGAELTSGLQAEEVRLSNLSLSVIFAGDDVWPRFANADISARLTDGTLVEAFWGGKGSYVTGSAHKVLDWNFREPLGPDTETAHNVLVWNFREPLDLDEVVGIYMNGTYYPVN